MLITDANIVEKYDKWDAIAGMNAIFDWMNYHLLYNSLFIGLHWIHQQRNQQLAMCENPTLSVHSGRKYMKNEYIWGLTRCYKV